MKLNKIILLVIFLPLFQCAGPNEVSKVCLLKGQVIGRSSTKIILLKSTEDFRYQGKEVLIATDGSFEYTLSADTIEEYELMFPDEIEELGYWKSVKFYNDSELIHFKLHPIDEFDSNEVLGSELTNKKKAYREEIQRVFYTATDVWYSKRDSIKNLTNGNDKYLRAIKIKLDSIHIELDEWKLNYIQANLNILSLKELWGLARSSDQNSLDFSQFNGAFSLFKKEYPDHPYTSALEIMLLGMENSLIGGAYTDFSAPDRSGRQVKISTEISKNKLTLIDLWAPWCGPCIRKSRKIEEYYSEFKSSGFDVVAVVGGIENKDKFDRAIERHNYPWTVLMEINNEFDIWDKYNITGSGGKQFLVDSTGKIVAINPAPEEIRKLLGNI